MQDEITERPLKRDLGASVEAAEIIRHESVVYPIQTERDATILGRRRRDRIRTRHLLALGSVALYGKPLSGHKAKVGYALYFEFDVLGKLGERDGVEHLCVESLERSHLQIR